MAGTLHGSQRLHARRTSCSGIIPACHDRDRPGGNRPMADMKTAAAATSLVFTLGLICFVRPGVAQQADSARQWPDSNVSAAALKKLSIEQLMDLQVTSVSKRPERLSQTASAIQVITQQDIRRSGASSLAEALRLASNLQVAQVDSRQWAISARGFNGTTANKLLVLIDGRTIYTPLFSGVFWDVQEVPLEDIDRIEVISGPGATLWGANAVTGRNVIAKWSRTLSERSSLTAQLYYDRTHRDIPRLFGEHLDTYDVELQHSTRLGARHDLVWGLGYRNINDRTVVGADSTLAFLPTQVAREWFTGFVQDEIALVPNRVHVTLGTKIEHNDYTGFEVQPSGRVSWRLASSGLLWAAVSRALRTPSRIDRDLFAPAKPPYFLTGGPDFHSEEELAYELGYRYQRGSVALSAATFYSRYHGLRSIEQVNPPNPVPLVIGNGQDGESYGGEVTAEYWLTSRWRVHAGYTELRVHVWPNPGSTDMSRGATESQVPDRQFLLQSWVDLPGHLGLAAGFRAIDDINNQLVPAYAELNATLTWQPTSHLDLSLVGQNLLHGQHREIVAATIPTRRDIQRGVYGAVAWRF